MRALVISDIHGSALAVKQALNFFEKFSCDKIFLLGDLMYHGPRNQLPLGHDPAEVAELLNKFADKIIAVRGNCDAEVDQMLLDFPCMEDFQEISDNNKKIFLSHGHLFDPKWFPLDKANIYFFGHTHIYNASKNSEGVYILNPGSVSLPRNNNPRTFGLYTEQNFSVFQLDNGNKILNITF